MPEPPTEQIAEPAVTDAPSDFGAQFLASVRADAASGERAPEPKAESPKPTPDAAATETAKAGDGEPTGEEQPEAEPSTEEKPPDNRRGAWKKAEQLEQTVAQLEQRLNELQGVNQQHEDKAATIQAMVAKFRGRDVDEHGKTALERAKEAAKAGDWQANEEYFRLVENDEFFGSLALEAAKEGHENLKANWAASFYDVADLPGVTVEDLKATKTPAESHRLLFTKGAASRDAEVNKLKEENATLKADHASESTHLISRSLAPMSGGLPASGLPSDASTDDKLRAGIKQREAARNGRH